MASFCVPSPKTNVSAEACHGLFGKVPEKPWGLFSNTEKLWENAFVFQKLGSFLALGIAIHDVSHYIGVHGKFRRKVPNSACEPCHVLAHGPPQKNDSPSDESPPKKLIVLLFQVNLMAHGPPPKKKIIRQLRQKKNRCFYVWSKGRKWHRLCVHCQCAKVFDLEGFQVFEMFF